MKIKKFEDINAWQEARKMINDIYKFTRSPKFSRDFGLSQQIQRASVSVMSNISEGFDSGTKAEFVRFLSYARRSASEVQSDLYIAFDQGYIKQDDFNLLYDQTEKVRRMITAFMKYLQDLTRQRANALNA